MVSAFAAFGTATCLFPRERETKKESKKERLRGEYESLILYHMDNISTSKTKLAQEAGPRLGPKNLWSQILVKKVLYNFMSCSNCPKHNTEIHQEPYSNFNKIGN